MTEIEDYQARELIARVLDRALLELALVRIRQELGLEYVVALALQAVGFSLRDIANIIGVNKSEVVGMLDRVRGVDWSEYV